MHSDSPRWAPNQESAFPDAFFVVDYGCESYYNEAVVRNSASPATDAVNMGVVAG